MVFGDKFIINHIGASISIIIFMLGNYFIHGINFDNIFEISKKYGVSRWDMNAYFIFLSSHYWIPIAFFFSYWDLGKNLTKFIRCYMQIGFLSTSTLECHFNEIPIFTGLIS